MTRTTVVDVGWVFTEGAVEAAAPFTGLGFDISRHCGQISGLVESVAESFPSRSMLKLFRDEDQA